MKHLLFVMALVVVIVHWPNSRTVMADELKLQPAKVSTAVAEKISDKLSAYLPESPDYVIEPPDVILVSMTKATTTTESLKLVGPDGNIEMEGLGKVFLAGLTRREAKQEIQRRCNKQENEKQISFEDVKVEIQQSNSKVVYLIHKNPRGDNVNRIPLNAPTTVRSMLKQAAWSHPVDFTTSKIELRRPSENNHQREEIVPIHWERDVAEPEKSADKKLLPGDRVFVTETNELEAAAIPPQPALEPLGFNAYARVGQPEFLFTIQLIEDRGGNLAELSELKTEFLVGDSKLLNGTLRILKKNQLVKVLAVQTILTKAGKQAHFMVGQEKAKADGSPHFRGTDIKITGKLHGEVLQVDFEGSVSEADGQTLSIDTSFMIRSGKTAIMKYPMAREADGKAVDYYWVVTPELKD